MDSGHLERGRQHEDVAPFTLLHLDHADSAWEDLEARYRRYPGTAHTSPSDRPLATCLVTARQAGARTAVIEQRYVDADYRSEYSAFYSKAFQPYSDTTDRIHFFSNSFNREDVYDLPDPSAYLGYMIIRPYPIRGAVGRTMLMPPPEVHESVRARATDKVHLFGQPLEVRAAPFVQQEGRLVACAQASAWMCHFTGALQDRDIARRPSADFSIAATPGLGKGRLIPTTGLSLFQMSELLGNFSRPVVHYEVAKLHSADRPAQWPTRHDTPAGRAARTACRYLNSGFPVIIVASDTQGGLHSYTLFGYQRDEGEPGGVWFLANDDRRGPYQWAKPLEDKRHYPVEETLTWEHILAPVPEKLWLSGDSAERQGSIQLLRIAENAKNTPQGPAVQGKQDQTSFDRIQQGAAKLLALRDEGDISLRTYAIESNRFKRRIRDRDVGPIVRKAYSAVRMPRYIWVVELVQRSLRRRNEPSVLGEILLDATSDEEAPVVVASRIPGLVAATLDENPKWDAQEEAPPTWSCGQYGA